MRTLGAVAISATGFSMIFLGARIEDWGFPATGTTMSVGGFGIIAMGTVALASSITIN